MTGPVIIEGFCLDVSFDRLRATEKGGITSTVQYDALLAYHLSTPLSYHA